jgi:hypothetical protein
MANTTSQTTTFDKTLSIDEIIEDSFERIGMQGVAGNQLRSARRSLNILFQEWGNRGIHYWEIIFLELQLMELQRLQHLLMEFMECPMSLKHN